MIVIALVCIGAFSLIIPSLVKMLQTDSRHEVAMVQNEQNYFNGQSAIEIAHRYFTDSTSTTTYQHGLAGGSGRTVSVIVGGETVVIQLKDAYEQ